MQYTGCKGEGTFRSARDRNVTLKAAAPVRSQVLMHFEGCVGRRYEFLFVLQALFKPLNQKHRKT